MDHGRAHRRQVDAAGRSATPQARTYQGSEGVSRDPGGPVEAGAVKDGSLRAPKTILF
jgi:hypothetical protein